MIQWTKNKWQRFKEWSTVDHWIDLFVDVGLIAFDVLNDHIKNFLKWFAHKVLRI